jgi:hypothetical protein
MTKTKILRATVIWDRGSIMIDWQKTIGMTIISADNLDTGKVIVDRESDYKTSNWITIEYGDHERFRIAKETIYRM